MDAVEEAARLLASARRGALGNLVRLAVMMLLVARGCLEFATLQHILGLTPGNLWGHVERLRGEGLLEARRALTVLGPRLVLCPTRTGIERTMELLAALRAAAEEEA